MFDRDDHDDRQPDPAAKLAGIVSTIAAIILTFFLFPFAFQGSVDGILDFSKANYGFGGGFIWFCWGVIVAVGLLTLIKLVFYYGIRLSAILLSR